MLCRAPSKLPSGAMASPFVPALAMNVWQVPPGVYAMIGPSKFDAASLIEKSEKKSVWRSSNQTAPSVNVMPVQTGCGVAPAGSGLAAKGPLGHTLANSPGAAPASAPAASPAGDGSLAPLDAPASPVVSSGPKTSTTSMEPAPEEPSRPALPAGAVGLAPFPAAPLSPPLIAPAAPAGDREPAGFGESSEQAKIPASVKHVSAIFGQSIVAA